MYVIPPIAQIFDGSLVETAIEAEVVLDRLDGENYYQFHNFTLRLSVADDFSGYVLEDISGDIFSLRQPEAVKIIRGINDKFTLVLNHRAYTALPIAPTTT